jgi:HAE1 family hydrophobic/amphiphilic exporter-1
MICLFGVLQFSKLSVALYPRTSQPQIDVWIDHASMGAHEFRTQYGKTIEDALRSLDGVKLVVGNFGGRSSQFQVDFDWNIKSDNAQADVKAAVDPIASGFPRIWGRPFVAFRGQFNSRFFYSISSDSLTIPQLSQFLKERLEPRLRSVQGLADLWTLDLDKKKVVIEINQKKLHQYGISFEQIFSVLAKREVDASLGTVTSPTNGSVSVFLRQHASSLKELRSTIVLASAGQRVTLEQIADVRLDTEVEEQSFKTDGSRSMLVGGYAKADANIRDVATSFRKIVESEAAVYQSGAIKIIDVLSPVEFISDSIEQVLLSVALSIVITTAVTYLFLGSILNTIFICLTIPLSGFGGFILMRLFNIEINLISMGAMALAVGMVVDGATIVFENISRTIDTSSGPLLERISAATQQVKAPVVASLLTTVIVFLPLPFTAPLASAILGDLAIVIVCVLVVSIAATVVLIPPILFHSYRVFPPKNSSTPSRFGPAEYFQVFYRKLEHHYLRILEFLLERRRWRLGLYLTCLILFALSVALLLYGIRREIIGTPETNRVFVRLKIEDQNLSIQKRERIIDQIEVDLRKKYGPMILHTLSEVNQNEPFLLITLNSTSSAKMFKDRVEQEYRNSSLIKYYISSWSPTSLEIPNPPLLRIHIREGRDEDRRTTIKAIQDHINKTEAYGHVASYPRSDLEKTISLKLKPWMIWPNNNDPSPSLSEASLLTSIRGLLDERSIYQMQIENKLVDVTVRVPKDSYRNANDLRNLQFRVNDRLIPLRAIADIADEEAYTDLYTENGDFRAFIDVWPKGIDKNTPKPKMRKQLESQIRELPFIHKAAIDFENRDHIIDENLSSLGLALLISLLLIIGVLLYQFADVRAVGVVLSAIPLGIIGTSLALWICQSTLSMNSLLGMMLLAGTAVNNSIVLVDFFCQSPGSTDIRQRIFEASQLRLRPIMITSMTTVFGMMPIAFAFGDGSSVLQPLGISVSAGLGISTLLTIFVVPCLLRDVRIGEVLS